MIWRRVALAVLWILSLLCISVYGGTVSYCLFFMITLVPLFSFVYMIAVAFGFKIYQEMDNADVVCDQQYDYYFILQNDMPFSFAGLRVQLFPDFFEVLEVPQDIEYELLPGEQFCFRTKLLCKYRGEYEVGVKSVVITDFLHIFRWKYNLISTYKANVRPKIVNLDKLKCMDEILSNMTRENQVGKTIPDVVTRDYVPGDSIRMIHWKATAKSGDLKVRNFYDENKQCICLYFEPKRYSDVMSVYLPLENKILETVISLTGFFAYQKLPINVTGGLDESKKIFVTGPKSFDPFYQSIAGTVFDESLDVEAQREAFFGKLLAEPSQIIFMVLHDITQTVLEYTEQLGNKGDYVVIFLVADEVSNEILSNNNERRQIVVIRTDDNLEKTL